MVDEIHLPELSRFPDNFFWSTATASYQVEGAWNEDGKSQSIWDVFSHTPGNIFNNQNGDIACNSYHKIDEDIEALKRLGVSHYRFSLSWPRILPKGTPEVINQKGVDYYNILINSLLENDIQPVVTIYHWDLPQCLQDKYGGWLCRDIIRDFVHYADTCFRLFGDRVKWWTPINEQVVVASLAYGQGIMAPGIKNSISFSFDVCHLLTLAHVEVWHLYNDKYRESQNGKIGLGAHCDWAEPISNNPENIEAMKRFLGIRLGLFCDPICKDGDYPALVKERFETLKKIGIIPADMVLPKFSKEEKIRNKGSLDFLGFNYYTSRLARNIDDGCPPSGIFSFLSQLAKVELVIDPSWKRGASPWLYSVPWALRKLLNHFKERYGDIPIYILENGFSNSGEIVDDESGRIDYLRSHLKAVLEAIVLDKVNVIGYTVWSLMDNFEWGAGYSEKFGLFMVDQNDPDRKRVAKKSVEFYADVIKKNGF